MNARDYEPLIERLRLRMSSWTSRHLSYAGRLQLLNSIIVSTINFWIQAFRLPNQCVKKIESLCASFLWSGPELNPKKSKVAWIDVCKPKKEGGLGVKMLKEANEVSCLKLIWRINSNKDSLWVRWIRSSLLRQGSIWLVRESQTMGSWMWRKLLKHREKAKTLHKVEIRNGETTFFWQNHWSSMGILSDVVGLRGTIDMGIPINSTVAEVMSNHRRRNHRMEILNKVEEEILRVIQAKTEDADINLWKNERGEFKAKFTTKGTWDQIRNHRPPKNWYKGVWFTHATPKYSFIVWLAALDRLSTGDRTRIWAGPSVCALCSNTEESRDHLFFACNYSSMVWKDLVGILLGVQYTIQWDDLLLMISNDSFNGTKGFIIKYTLQAAVYHLWQERNNRRHGKEPLLATTISKLIDKTVRNRLSSIMLIGDHSYEDGLEKWFATRHS